MNAESFASFLENAASALLLMLVLLVAWVILKRMTSAMRKGVISAESSLIDGSTVSVSSDQVEIRFFVPKGWNHECHLTLLDGSHSVVETLHSGHLTSGEQSFSFDHSTRKVTFLRLETDGQTLERRIS